ncbi:hypothetical protein NDU88_002317 [Pleurodeles waltl]|uniref:Uncharacterized protein n=1 Tax=Pleurodeles waltl TaxID=8319 RepID=A0AAV7UWX4_PLEWA|nr:hypothetical protein NDU88_002317 [Pleurodeles waltl]
MRDSGYNHERILLTDLWLRNLGRSKLVLVSATTNAIWQAAPETRKEEYLTRKINRDPTQELGSKSVPCLYRGHRKLIV